MFHLTPKTKGKTAQNLPIPGAKKKASRTTAAHRRGHVPSPLPIQAPPSNTESMDAEPDELTGDESGESNVAEGGNTEGPESPVNIADEPSIASAIQSIKARRKGKPSKYDGGTNTYR